MMDLLPAVDYDAVVAQGARWAVVPGGSCDIDQDPVLVAGGETEDVRDESFPDVVVNRVGEDVCDGAESHHINKDSGRKVWSS